VTHTAQRVGFFSESVIREMTRLNNLYGGVNLAQGFPDFPAPPELIAAAEKALRDGFNQYAITWGAPNLRRAIAEKFAAYNGVTVDPDAHVTVTCGATEAMIATLLAVVDPGDEVVIFEPFYENYGPDTRLSGAVPRYVPLQLDDPAFAFDPEALRQAFGPKTRAVVINTPHNPTGKVFTADELAFIADLCRRHDALAITDEVYEHLIYDGRTHVSMASLPGMDERTVTINSVSKTYSVTGWRVGWAIIKDAAITTAIRKAHDFLTVGAAAPLQEAGAVALRFPPEYYERLASMYRAKRDRLLGILRGAGFQCFVPYGAYYIMTDITNFGVDSDVAFCRMLVQDVGIATVPGSSFYSEPASGRRYVRFAYPKKDETLTEAARRLAALSSRVAR
jgi:aminotransferase